MGSAHVIMGSQRWEYLTLTRKSESFLMNDLNDHGQQGWELVSASYYKDMKGSMVWTAFLKRPTTAKGASKPPTSSEAQSDAHSPSADSSQTSSRQSPAESDEGDYRIAGES